MTLCPPAAAISSARLACSCPPDVGEVDVARCAFNLRRWPFRGECEGDRIVAAVVRRETREALRGQHVDPFDERGLGGVLRGDDDVLEAELLAQRDHGQDALGVAQTPVQ